MDILMPQRDAPSFYSHLFTLNFNKKTDFIQIILNIFYN